MNNLIRNEEGNEILGFVIVALITTVVGGVLLTCFNDGAKDIFDSLLDAIKTKISF
ncbi:MAG: hypothetical protein IKC38_07260 [Clostridia bacterium]|nr:hypothetical protein [Clostridia bacterium]